MSLTPAVEALALWWYPERPEAAQVHLLVRYWAVEQVRLPARARGLVEAEVRVQARTGAAALVRMPRAAVMALEPVGVEAGAADLLLVLQPAALCFAKAR
jgi:hypothetical protein